MLKKYISYSNVNLENVNIVNMESANVSKERQFFETLKQKCQNEGTVGHIEKLSRTLKIDKVVLFNQFYTENLQLL